MVTKFDIKLKLWFSFFIIMKVKQIICHAGKVAKEFIEDQPIDQLSDTRGLKECLRLGAWDGEKLCMYHCNIYTYHNNELVSQREEIIDGCHLDIEEKENGCIII